MHRRPAFLIILSLVLGVSPERVAAEPGGPPPVAESDSSEIARNVPDPALVRSDRDFLPYAGKPIRRIRVDNLDVFGPSVDEAARPSESRLLRFLNHLNFRTRENTIRGSLLFREGDMIDPFRLAESERILRGLVFIGDARIVVAPAPGSDDSADVRVIVKETWTLQLSGSPTEGNGLKANLADQNLLGLGHQISAGGTWMPDADPRLGFHTSYAVQNIQGTFVTAKLAYEKTRGKETAGLSFSRELFSPILQYAGGSDFRRTSIVIPDSLSSGADNSSDLVDFWAGRTVHRWRDEKGTRRRILFLSGRVRHLEFTERPAVTPSTYSEYHDMDHYLGSISYIQSRSYRTTLLHSFGRTEDIPYGFLARVTYGLADEEFSRSDYASATLAAGEKIGGLGYGACEARLGGYPRRGDLEQGVIRLRTLYFSDLMHAGGFRFRHFLRAQYTAGIHRFADDGINFEGDKGIRGVVYNRGVIGSERLLLNLESVTFAPWKARGVTFAFFTFTDLDFIGAGGESPFTQRGYSGLGLGVRLYKEGFGFGPVQLRFAWYPGLPIVHDEFSYTAFVEDRFRSIEFLGGSPEIVEY